MTRITRMGGVRDVAAGIDVMALRASGVCLQRGNGCSKRGQGLRSRAGARGAPGIVSHSFISAREVGLGRARLLPSRTLGDCVTELVLGGPRGLCGIPFSAHVKFPLGGRGHRSKHLFSYSML